MSIHNREIAKDPSDLSGVAAPRRWIVPALLLVAALSLAVALVVVPEDAHGARDPKAPSGLSAALADGVVTLTWSAPTEDAVSVTGYQVLRRRPGVDAVGIFHIVEERIGGADRTYADRTANEPGGKYTYRVKAWRCEDLSAWSNYSRIDLAASFTAPEAITQDPTVTPDPSADCATSTSTATNTATATQTATAPATHTATATPTPTATATATATHTATATATHTATATSTPTSEPAPEPEPVSAAIAVWEPESVTGEVEVGGSVKGELAEHGEIDWYRVELFAGGVYRVDMRGSWGGEWKSVDGRVMYVSPGTLHNPHLGSVRDGTGADVPSGDVEVNGEGLNSRIVALAPTASGTYYIAAGAHEDAGTGTYELSVSVVVAAPATPTPETTATPTPTATSTPTPEPPSTGNQGSNSLVPANLIVQIDGDPDLGQDLESRAVMVDQESQSNGFVKVDAGWVHMCALRTDGTVECWGLELNRVDEPLRTPEGIYKKIVAGNDSSCGIRDDGSAHCWNDFSGFSESGGVQEIATYTQSGVCFLNEDGTVGCSGAHYGAPTGQHKSIAAGYHIGCALNSDDEAVCWQNNSPLQTPDDTFKSLAMGGLRACGIKMDDTLKCWSYGYLDYRYRVEIHGNSFHLETGTSSGTFKHVDLHYLQTCGVTVAGDIKCWMGAGTETSLVKNMNLLTSTGDFEEVSMDWYLYACGLKTDKSIVCWKYDGTVMDTPSLESPWHDNADLLSLSLSGIEIEFDRDTLTYTAAVGNDVATTTVAAGTTNLFAAATISPADDDSTTDGHQVNLSVGTNTITITVNAADGVTTKTYTVTVTRAS